MPEEPEIAAGGRTPPVERLTTDALVEVVASAPCGVVIVDEAGWIVSVNARASRDFGYEPAELIGREVEVLVPEGARARHRAERAGFQPGPYHSMGAGRHLVGRRKDSSEFPVEIGLTRLSQGLVAAFIVDISVREKAERAVRESEARFRALVEHAPEAIVVIDAESGLFADANSNALHLLGASLETITRLGPADVSPPLQPDGESSAAKAARKIHEAVAGAVPVFEWLYMTADGREIPCEVRLHHLPHADRVLVRGSIIDVSGRKAAEHRYRTLFENASDAILVVDAHGAVLESNRHASDLFGITRAALAKRTFDSLIRENDEQRRCLAVALEHGAARADNVALARDDGHARLVDISASTIAIEGETFVFVMLCDVTIRQKLQAQLRVSDRLASLGLLSAGIAHEINNPLAAILGNLDVLAREFAGAKAAELSDPAVDALLDARSAAERVRAIVRDLRSISRGGEEETRGAVDVHRVLESTLRMARHEIEPRARVVRQFGRVPSVEASERRLAQVFLNLIVNAAQAIPEGRAHENEIVLSTRTDEAGRVVVEVRDTGTGMSPETLGHLFEPFFTTKPLGVGTGLGLSICHRIVTSFGGELAAESQLGKGTCFRVLLPALQTREALPDVPRSAAAPISKELAVLVIDDDRSIVSTIQRLLEPEYHVSTVTAGQDALDLVAAGKSFDVILCDLMMPQMTGMDLYAELRRVSPVHAERVVFLTGGAFTPLAQAFVAQVPNAIVEKPFTSEQLRIALDRVAHR